MFQLTEDENASLRSQNVTANPTRGGNRFLPHAFTEHGALMAANVLNSPQAVEMSVYVVRAFIQQRAMLAAHGLPTAWQLTWIVVAMVAARSAAMAFNRLVDTSYDAQNPRTRMRALPAGLLSKQFVAAFVVGSCAVFIFAAAQLNRLCLYLSPIALAVLLSYSYTKRFTRWSHLVLGFADAIPPAAAWIAIRGTLDWHILPLVGAVTFWVAGFDVLYACQDYDFDCSANVYSVPMAFGIRNALRLARLFHVITFALLVWMALAFGLGKIALAGVFIVGVLLIYEHSLVKHDDLRRLNAAFFTMNGFISMGFLFFIAADFIVRR
jgi:4-hydroxybenzoate polyprenyltransferase